MAGYFNEDVPVVVLKSLFSKYDKDGSGSLDADEVRVFVLSDLGMSEDQAETFFMSRDKDGDQKVTFQEFHEWIRSGEWLSVIDDSSRFYMARKAVEAFKELDKDGSGVLERSEVGAVVQSVGAKREDLDAALKATDTGGDGTVSFSEFLDWLNWLPRN